MPDPTLAECVARWRMKEERRMRCGTEGYPHDFVQRIIGPFHPQFVKTNREWLEELTRGMSPLVCRICRKAAEEKP